MENILLSIVATCSENSMPIMRLLHGSYSVTDGGSMAIISGSETDACYFYK